MLFLITLLLCFFFFKQKTAYEMRISDWSSDVCSSDLEIGDITTSADPRASAFQSVRPLDWGERIQTAEAGDRSPITSTTQGGFARAAHPGSENDRSEEHTSELQSLMRISYAVFCLKKKKINKTKEHISSTNTKIIQQLQYIKELQPSYPQNQLS